MLAFRPNSRELAAAGSDGKIRLLGSGARRRMLNGRTTISAIAFHPDGKTLAAASVGGVVRLLDVVEQGERARLVGPDNEVTALAFNEEGTSLAAAGSDDGTDNVLLLDPTTRNEPSPVSWGPKVVKVAYRSDGALLASLTSVRPTDAQRRYDGNDHDHKDDPGTVTLRNPQSHERGPRARLPGVNDLAIRPRNPLGADRPVVAIATELGVMIWRAAAPRRLGTDAPVNTVAFSANGERLAVGGADGAVVTYRGTARARYPVGYPMGARAVPRSPRWRSARCVRSLPRRAMA